LQAHSARATIFVASCYGKVDLACQAIAGYRAAQGSLAGQLLLDRYPNLKTAIAGERIEIPVITLEVGDVGHFQARRRQPVIPDRVDGAANGRDMVAMGKDRVFLRGKIRKFRNK